MFQSHQVCPGGIDGNCPEAVTAKLPVLFNEHVDNFASRLSKTNEKYPHGPKTPSGRFFRDTPKCSIYKVTFRSSKTFLYHTACNGLYTRRIRMRSLFYPAFQTYTAESDHEGMYHWGRACRTSCCIAP